MAFHAFYILFASAPLHSACARMDYAVAPVSESLSVLVQVAVFGILRYLCVLTNEGM